MSSVKHVRTVFAVNLRFPTPGHSASGLVGPKARSRDVGDGHPVNIPEPPRLSEGVTQRGRPAFPSDMEGAKRVGVEAGRQIRRLSRGVIACPRGISG